LKTLQEWASDYERRGFAVARLRAGQKRPVYKAWNTYSFPVERFRKTDSIGIQSGRLSGDLVCVDLDDPGTLADADRYLPPTEMVEGRPGKPRSHRWYRVVNTPDHLRAPPKVAGGIGGPRTRLFKPKGRPGTLVEFRGTGSQAVVPPSIWTSKDGDRREHREWDRFGEPAVVDCQELFDCVCRLAAAHGWSGATKCERRPSTVDDDRVICPDRLPLPPGEPARQARAYIAKMDPAVEGQGGDHQTYRVACVLVIDFGLTPEEGLPLLLEFNQRCLPPWSTEALVHKLAMADQQDGPRGQKVRKRARAIVINIQDNEVVYVGVDCKGEGRSFVDLSPSLYAGIAKAGNRRELSPELAAIEWQGRQVILTPASTIATNKQEVWGEFFLANLLREHGADVKSLHLPPLAGRRRTFSRADGTGTLVDPPVHPWEAAANAVVASRRAHELQLARKALPRKKASPKLTMAVRFVLRHGVTRLTKDVIQTAFRRGISRDSLRRAIGSKNQ
jgi:hypothetical protein